MRRFVLRRAARALVVFWGVSTVVFLVMRLSGDPITLLVAPETPVADIERLRHEMGLDAPLIVQYVRFLGEVVRGDFGAVTTDRGAGRGVAPDRSGRRDPDRPLQRGQAEQRL
jgi:peptide/nickel transport system permease protein